MESLINELMKKPLSNTDILEAVHHKTNLVTYKELMGFSTLQQLLGKYKCCVILYDINESNCGHWCLIMQNNSDEVEFFDPYGLIIDGWIDKAHPSKRL